MAASTSSLHRISGSVTQLSAGLRAKENASMHVPVRGVIQAKAKTKAPAPTQRNESVQIETLRMPWAAVAAATALVTLGSASDHSAFSDARSLQNFSLLRSEASVAGEEPNALSTSSLSAPMLVSSEASLDAFGSVSDSDMHLYLDNAAAPLQNAFNPDDFRAKLPDGSGPLGGNSSHSGDWFFSSMKHSRECPAWGSNKAIELVVPGAAKPLQPVPPRGSKRWFASFDTSQLQGSQPDIVEEVDEQGSAEFLEVAENAHQEEKGSEAKKKDPFEGLIFEIVRMPVFSCFSL